MGSKASKPATSKKKGDGGSEASSALETTSTLTATADTTSDTTSEDGKSLDDLMNETQWSVVFGYLSHRELCESIAPLSHSALSLLNDPLKFPEFTHWNQCRAQIQELFEQMRQDNVKAYPTRLKRESDTRMTGILSQSKINRCIFAIGRRFARDLHSPLFVVCLKSVFGVVSLSEEEDSGDHSSSLSMTLSQPWMTLDHVKYLIDFSGLDIALNRGSIFQGKAVIQRSLLTCLSEYKTNYFDNIQMSDEMDEESLTDVDAEPSAGFEVKMDDDDGDGERDPPGVPDEGTDDDDVSPPAPVKITSAKGRSVKARIKTTKKSKESSNELYSELVAYLQSKGAKFGLFQKYWSGRDWTKPASEFSEEDWDTGLLPKFPDPPISSGMGVTKDDTSKDRSDRISGDSERNVEPESLERNVDDLMVFPMMSDDMSRNTCEPPVLPSMGDDLFFRNVA